MCANCGITTPMIHYWGEGLKLNNVLDFGAHNPRVYGKWELKIFWQHKLLIRNTSTFYLKYKRINIYLTLNPPTPHTRNLFETYIILYIFDILIYFDSVGMF